VPVTIFWEGWDWVCIDRCWVNGADVHEVSERLWWAWNYGGWLVELSLQTGILEVASCLGAMAGLAVGFL